MENGPNAYKPPPCSVFLVGNRRSRITKIITQKRHKSRFFQKMKCLGEESEQLSNCEKVLANMQAQQFEWDHFLENSNSSKFQPEEWVQRWLHTIEQTKELNRHCSNTNVNNIVTDTLAKSDSGTGDSLSEFVWAGQWSAQHPGQHQTKNGNERIDSEEYTADSTCVLPQVKSKTEDYNTEIMNDDTSGVGSSEQKIDSAIKMSYSTVDGEHREFNAAGIFSESNKKVFVTMSCENSLDIGTSNKVNERTVWICQREVCESPIM